MQNLKSLSDLTRVEVIILKLAVCGTLLVTHFDVQDLEISIMYCSILIAFLEMQKNVLVEII